MQIILFSQNKHKIKEIEAIFCGISNSTTVRCYDDFIESFDVIEDGDSFKSNALLKLQSLKDKLPDKIIKDSILMSEDSGICIKELNNRPGIYASRYANISDFGNKDSIANAKNASDEENINKLINDLKDKNLESSLACFISCVAVFANNRFLITHGFLGGNVTIKKSGKNGFGYDPVFIPNDYKSTLAELDSNTKNIISHRFKALNLMKLLLK